MFIMAGGLLLYHLKLLRENMTTNEDINRSKYSYLKDEFYRFSNPFSKGSSWNNIIDGLFPSEKLYYTREAVVLDNCRNQVVNENEGYFEEAKVKLLT